MLAPKDSAQGWRMAAWAVHGTRQDCTASPRCFDVDAARVLRSKEGLRCVLHYLEVA